VLQIKAHVLSNEQLAEGFWCIRLEAPQIASEIKPGQFINVKVTESNDPLFRRPFGVFRRVNLNEDEFGIEVVYEVVGKGTRLMTSLREGDELDVIGPLGHGFEWECDKKVHILVGGGVGSPTLFMLGEEISEVVVEHKLELIVLLDARTKKHLILEQEFRTLNAKVLVATHDGTHGYHGYVTEMLKDYIDKGEISSDCVIYACGPELMFKALTPICRQYRIPAQVCMERRMGCGIGACLSCACKVDKNGVLKYRDLGCSHIQFSPEEDFGYALVCQDGPVFNIDEVILDE